MKQGEEEHKGASINDVRILGGRGGSGNSDFSKKGLENKIRTKGGGVGVGSKSPKKFGRHQWMSPYFGVF